MEKLDAFISLVYLSENNEKTLESDLKVASSTLKKYCNDYEIIIIDNNSNQDTQIILQKVTSFKGLSNFRVYFLSKRIENNYALFLGVEDSLGDHIISIDPQVDDVGNIEKAIKEIKNGYEVIFLYNEQNINKSFLYNIMKSFLILYFRIFLKIIYPKRFTSFRLISKNVLNYILRQKQPKNIYKNLFLLSGFKRKNIYYKSNSTFKTRESIISSIATSLQLIMSLSLSPIRFITFLTFFGALINLLYTIYVISSYFTKDVAPGWASLSLQQSGMFFLISLVLLLMSEYILNLVGDLDDKKHLLNKELNSSNHTSVPLNIKE